MEIIQLSCEAEVGGETVITRMEISPNVYADPEALEFAKKHLRMTLAEKIVERFPPKISVERVSLSPWRAV